MLFCVYGAATYAAPNKKALKIQGPLSTSVYVGQDYNYISVIKNKAKLTFSITNKPVWILFNAKTGGMSGRPTDANIGITKNIVISGKDRKRRKYQTPAFNLTVLPSGNIPVINTTPDNNTNGNGEGNNPSPSTKDPTVEQPNRAPVIGGSPSVTANTGQTYSFSPTGSDPDNNNLTFSITNKPAWATFDPATGKLSGVPGLVDVGTTSGIAITVDDGKGETASLPPFNITVSAFNIAKAFGVANQGGTYGSEVASLAVDGLDSTVNHTTCNATTNWWQVQLARPTLISKIVVRNRTNNEVRLNGAIVYVTDAPYTGVPLDTFKVFTLTGASGDQNITFTTPKSGTYVIIKAANAECLHMREVEVYGQLPTAPVFQQAAYEFTADYKAPVSTQVGTVKAVNYQNSTPLTYQIQPGFPFLVDAQGNIKAKETLKPIIYNFNVTATNGVNTATTQVKVNATANVAQVFGTASQGSDYNNTLTADKVIDGLNSTNNHTACTATGNWWQVQLPRSTLINRIVVRNMTNNQARLNGAAVYVTDAPYTGVPAVATKVFTLTGASGDQNITFNTLKSGTYVIIKAANAECLHMREVEVYGEPPVAPVFTQALYNFDLWAAAPVGTAVGVASAKDFQGETISYSLVGNVPFNVDSQGKLTVKSALQPGATYSFDVVASDGANQSTAAVSVKVTSSTAYQNALQTGVATGVLAPELRLAADAFVANIKVQQAQTVNSIFRLANDGSLQAGSISGINWDPIHDSVWFDNLNLVANVPTLVSNAAKADGISQNKTLAVAGVKDNGARYAVMGGNPLHDLSRTTEPGGSGNAQLGEFLKSQLAWLTQRNDLATGAFKVVIAHQSDSYWFKHDATTRKWITTNYPNATVNVSDACESALLAGCLTGADLLVIGRDNGAEDNHGVPFDLNTVMQTVRTAQANGIPVLYLQYDGDMNNLGLALMDYFSLTTTDNYWRQEYLDNFSPISLNAGGSNSLDAIQTVIDALDSGTYNFAFDEVNCTDFVGTTTCDPAKVNDQTSGGTLKTEFFAGVEAIRASLQAFDQKGINVFALDDSYRLLKTAVLLGDKYRDQIQYPMDKISTDNTTFFRALFADYTVHYARPNNVYQPDMGDFTDAQPALNMAPTITRSLTFTPTAFDEWTSTGLYAPPGKTITVRRTDSGTSDVKIRFNYLRLTTRLWNFKQYSRPRYMSSPSITLKAGQTYTFSTPYGGPVYLGWSAVQTGATPFTVELSNVLDNPLLQAFDDASINLFLNDIEKTASDWVDIKTPFAEIHSLKSYMLSAFANQDGNAGNGYTFADVQAYIDDVNNYLIVGNYAYAGFAGTGLRPLNAEVQTFCSAFQLTSVEYDGATKNLCTDAVIHAKPKIQHINSDVNAACGGLCAGNPFDSGGPIDPLGWGESHEMGHNLQRGRLNIYGRSGEVSNNIFPLHTQWSWTVAQGLSKHPSTDRPANPEAFNILQNAINAGAVANSSHPLWSETGTYDEAFERLSFYMQLPYTQQSWDLYTKLYLLERIYSDAIKSDAKWNAVKDRLGFGSYTRTAASSIKSNDFMYIAISTIGNRNYSDYFEVWGIDLTQAAKDQVTLNNITDQVPRLFYYVHRELPAVMPTIVDTLPLDGVSLWTDPTP